MNDIEYIGMDVHQKATWIVVLHADGRVVMSAVVETQAQALLSFVQGQRGTLHVTFEEGTYAAWLYDLLVSHVTRLVVCDPRHNALLKAGSKSDPLDAGKLAELLRLNALRPVYHGEQSLRTLKELSRAYRALVQDSTRVMNRIKALYRGRGIACAGREVYAPGYRASWIARLPEAGVRQRAEWLYQELDGLRLLRRQAKRALLLESRKHPAHRSLRGLPGLGAVRIALLPAIIQTPFRFRNKRLFWAYVGLGLVTRVSAEFCVVNGQLKRSGKAPALRGLNPNHQRQLKEIFKSAASTAVRRPGPWQQFYLQRLALGRKPELVRLTVARKLATLTLSLWKKGGRYDQRLSAGGEDAQARSTPGWATVAVLFRGKGSADPASRVCLRGRASRGGLGCRPGRLGRSRDSLKATLGPLAQPHKAIGLEPPIEPWLAVPLPALRLQSSKRMPTWSRSRPCPTEVWSRISFQGSQGREAERSSPRPVEGEDFLLTSPFIEPPPQHRTGVTTAATSPRAFASGLVVTFSTSPILERRLEAGLKPRAGGCRRGSVYVRPFKMGHHQAQEGRARRQAREDLHQADPGNHHRRPERR